MSTSLEENTEILSPSGKYKLVIHSYKKPLGSTKGPVYSTNTNEWVGEIERNYPVFPYLFFTKGNREYLISGRSDKSQTIIDCETGHIYENTDDFCWRQMWQVDENTLCVGGCYQTGPYIYRFFDFSNISMGWRNINVKREGGVPMPKHDYILKDNDLSSENNYPDPIIEDDTITFHVKETRIYGVGVLGQEVKEIDMTLKSYEEQEKNGFKIPIKTDKIYQIDLVRMKFKREGDDMVMFEYWRDEKQLREDLIMDKMQQGARQSEAQSEGQSEEEQSERSLRYQTIRNLITERFKNKFTVSKNNITIKQNTLCNLTLYPNYTKRHCFHIIFSYDNNDAIIVKYHNWKFPNQNTSVTCWNEKTTIDMIEY